MSIRIFVTGGTFDKEYNELKGKLELKTTHLEEMLKLAHSSLDIKITHLMMVDSLKMTAGEREKIASGCLKSRNKKIVITHGTDTMVETASVLAEKVTGKTIILTGALVPYKFGSSDGLFNLGTALAFVQTRPAGIYIAMNGRCFYWNNCRKDKKTGKFISS